MLGPVLRQILVEWFPIVVDSDPRDPTTIFGRFNFARQKNGPLLG